MRGAGGVFVRSDMTCSDYVLTRVSSVLPRAPKSSLVNLLRRPDGAHQVADQLASGPRSNECRQERNRQQQLSAITSFPERSPQPTIKEKQGKRRTGNGAQKPDAQRHFSRPQSGEKPR